MGLQLKWLGPYCQVDVSACLHPTKSTLRKRLAMLNKLVRKAFITAGPEVKAEFADWFASARKARALRNQYAHGRWGVPMRGAESPLGPEHPRVPMLEFVRLDWDTSSNRPDSSTYMTVEELREEVAEAVGVFQAFFALVDKHRAHCLPSQPTADLALDAATVRTVFWDIEVLSAKSLIHNEFRGKSFVRVTKVS